jgi:hypothetical protein
MQFRGQSCSPKTHLAVLAGRKGLPCKLEWPPRIPGNLPQYLQHFSHARPTASTPEKEMCNRENKHTACRKEDLSEPPSSPGAIPSLSSLRFARNSKRCQLQMVPHPHSPAAAAPPQKTAYCPYCGRAHHLPCSCRPACCCCCCC